MTDGRRLSCKPIRANLDGRLTSGDHRVLDAMGAHADLRTGKVTAGSETLRSYARMGPEPMGSRGFLKCTDHLEELGYLIKKREGVWNTYQVVYDPIDAAVVTLTSDTGTGIPPSIDEATPEPGFRSDTETGTGVPGDRNRGSDETGTGVLGERVNSTELLLTTTDAAREADRNGGSGVISQDSEKQHQNPGSGVTSETEDSLQDELTRLAIALAVAANAALRDNPAVRAQNDIHPMSAALARDPLKGWLDQGIPFELIQSTVADLCRRFKPKARGHRINGFGYFNNAVIDAWESSKALSDLAAAAPIPIATAKKRLRRLG